MKAIPAILILTSLFQCGENSNDEKCYAAPCSIPAIVIDLTGLDGCGLALELADGKRLIPEMRTYVQAPKPEEDPIYYFKLEAGQTVTIGYEKSSAVSACMAGEVVFITCISLKEEAEK